MTDRERWILYPLLFLAVGLGLRNGIMSQAPLQDADLLDANTVRCKTLLVYGNKAGPRGTPVVAIGSGDEGGTGIVETFNGEGKRQVVLGSTPAGGLLTLFDPRERYAMVAGNEGQFIGLAVGRFEGNQFVPVVTLPLVAARPASQTPSEQSGKEDGQEQSEPDNEQQQPSEPKAHPSSGESDKVETDQTQTTPAGDVDDSTPAASATPK